MKTTIPESNFLTAIITGIGITITAGAILFPLVYLAVYAFFDLYVFADPPPNAWIKDYGLIIVFCVWLFIATAAGGWACAGASERNEYNHALFLAMLWAVIALLLHLYFASEEPIFTLALAIALGIAGYFTGTKLRMRKKQKAGQIAK